MSLHRRFYTLILCVVMLFGEVPVVNGQRIGFHLEGNRRRVKIPIEIHNNLIVVEVVVNDVLPLKFILDTGVRSNILVDKYYTDLLGVNYSRMITLYGLGRELSVNAYIASNVKLKMPGVTATGQAILVLETDLLQFRNYLGVDIHGIIGYEIFSRFVVGIDYSSEVLTLYDPAHFKKRKKYQTVDLDVIDTKPYIDLHVLLNDTTSMNAKLMIDTGASHALVLNKDSDERINIPEKNIRAKLGRGLTGDIEGNLGRAKALEISDYRLNDVIVSYPDTEMYLDTLLYAHRNGSIGGEILRKFDLVFDYSSRKLYLKKNFKFKQPFEYNMSGLEVVADGRNLDKFKIEDVREGSPAALAGVLPGDQITDINELSQERLSLSRIFNILNAKEGKRITMSVDRNNRKLKFRFFLHREI